MKKTLPLFLIISLVANAALLTAVLRRTPGAPPTGTVKVASAQSNPPASAGLPAGLRDALASGDKDALIAAGLPPEAVRDLAVGRAYMKQVERTRAVRSTVENKTPYWRRQPSLDVFGVANRETRMEYMKIQREYREELRAAAGDDALTFYGADNEATAFLSGGQRDQLRRINEDYAELMAEVYADAGGFQLPSDQEKTRLLQAEKERDIAALLGPEAYQQYLLRTSNPASNVRNRYGAVIQSEAEFQQLYQLQKAFEDEFSFNSPGARTREWQQARLEAQQELQQQINTLLGPERAAAAEKSNDMDYRILTNLSNRLKLPANTADSIYALRDTYAAQAQQINANADLSREERAAQLRLLGSQAQATIQQTLGAEAAGLYAERSSWLGALKRGAANFRNSTGGAGPAINFTTGLPAGRN